MLRFAIVATIIFCCAPTLAHSATQNVPPPGTVEDLGAPVKFVADGPPRPLIRMVSDNHPEIVAAVRSNLTAR